MLKGLLNSLKAYFRKSVLSSFLNVWFGGWGDSGGTKLCQDGVPLEFTPQLRRPWVAFSLSAAPRDLLTTEGMVWVWFHLRVVLLRCKKRAAFGGWFAALCSQLSVPTLSVDFCGYFKAMGHTLAFCVSLSVAGGIPVFINTVILCQERLQLSWTWFALWFSFLGGPNVLCFIFCSALHLSFTILVAVI